MEASSQQPPAIPPGQEWWTQSLFGWQARALRAKAEAAVLREEAANQRQRIADLLELLQASPVSA